MFKRIQIWWLKRQLHGTYDRFLRELEGTPGGYHMALHTNPRLPGLARRCNAIMSRLQKLDVACQKLTLPASLWKFIKVKETA